ncbi:MAG: cytochrome c oxidase subunit 3 [Bdellovibrionaceae bacterium]|nr:cytochrome c oxidase subunit 3 [Pseudobdellovibrionaceae bacterium]
MSDSLVRKTIELDSKEESSDSPSLSLLLRPPGGLLIWLVIAVELLTYGGAIGAFLYERAANIEMFREFQAGLNLRVAAINTIVLLVSGFLIAQAVASHHLGQRRNALFYLLGSAALGMVFLGLKGSEYLERYEAGLGIGENIFLGYYWGLTGFHFLHVVVGVVILLGMALHLARGGEWTDEDAGLETGAAFWHLCDLIWVVLFPLLFILN